MPNPEKDKKKPKSTEKKSPQKNKKAQGKAKTNPKKTSKNVKSKNSTAAFLKTALVNSFKTLKEGLLNSIQNKPDKEALKAKLLTSAKLKKAGAFKKSLMVLAHWLHTVIFYTYRYSPLPWVFSKLKVLVKFIKRNCDTVYSWKLKHPRLFKGTLYSSIFIFVVSFLSFEIYSMSGISFSVTEIGPTNVEDNASPDPLQIFFNSPVAPLDALDKNLTEGVRISPSVQGYWRWRNDRSLVFTPAEDWKIGKTYYVSFKKTFFAKHVRLKSYSFSFKTAPFTGRITSEKLYQDPMNPKVNKVVATVKFSHPVETDSFSKYIKATISYKDTFTLIAQDLKTEVSFNKYKTEAYIYTEPIQIKIKAQVVKIFVNTGLRSLRDGVNMQRPLNTSVDIPDIETFFHVETTKVALVTNEYSESEHVLVIETSAGVESNELKKNIKLYTLPVDRAISDNIPPDKNYAWFDVGQVTPYVLKNSQPIKLEPIETVKQYAKLHSFRLNVPPGRHIYLHINKGVEAIGSGVLIKPYDVIYQIPEFPKEIKIARTGSVLSLNGEKKLTVLSRDLGAIYYEIGKVRQTDVAHLVTQAYTYGDDDLGKPHFSSYGNFDEDDIVERYEKIVKLGILPPGKLQYSSLDFSDYLATKNVPYGIFILNVRGYDLSRKEKTAEKDNRLILVTDLGILMKTSHDKSQDVFVQSIRTGRPVEGAKVEILGKNGLPVRTAYTDSEGRAHIFSLKGLKREKYPVVATVTYGRDFSFLPLNMYKRNLEFSRFDVGGEYISEKEKNIDAYLFSDRGLYRPGDTFHVGIILKSPVWQGMRPLNHLVGVPLQAVVTDPRGQEIYRKSIHINGEGFHELSYASTYASPTGTYHVKLYIVKKDGKQNETETLLGSTEVRLEEFLPDTMKITAKFNKEVTKGWVAPENLSVNVSLWNLFGTPAVHHKITSSVRLSPAPIQFSDYPDYVFHDPLKPQGSFTEPLSEVYTDEKGQANIPLSFRNMGKATYSLVLTAEGHAMDGGRAVTTYRSMIISPLKYIVGYKADGDLGFVRQGTPRSVHIIAVNNELQKTAVKNIKLELIEQNFVSTLARQSDGTYSYQTVRKKISKGIKTIEIPRAGYNYDLSEHKPGDYLVVVRDENDVELNSFEFTVAGAGEVSARLEKNSELQIRLDKKDYRPGEEIKVSIRAPYAGSGLISIEREKVYSFIWFKTHTNESIQTITVPGRLQGNAYINVAFMRDIESPEIYSSPLSYGVVPFSINRDSRNNRVTLVSPKRVMPGQTLPIHFKTSQPGKIAIMAVDEGILQVASHRTPNPLGYFFRKRALQVNTAQILDLILPEFSILQKLSKEGGGMGLLSGASLNPFRAKQKPAVAYWSGIIDAGEDGGTVYYKVPDYFNGSLRIMAVAVGSQTVGAARDNVTVKGNFILTPSMPLFAAPGDEFEVSLNIANNYKGSGPKAVVEATVQATKQLQPVGEVSKKVEIAENSEGVAKFKFKALEKFGQADVNFTVAYAKTRTHYQESMSIRPPIAYRAKLKSGFVSSGSQNISLDRKTYPEYKKTELLISPVPLTLGYGLNEYLVNYPYGCTEQIVSQAVPAFLLKNRPEFGYNTEKANKAIEHTLKTLKERQNSSGAIGFWGPGSYADIFQNIYAMHFLTELKESGYPIENSVLTHGLKYIYDTINHSAYSLNEGRVIAYGIYVLTRNGILTTNQIMTLQESLDKIDKSWRKDITAAYLAASFQLMKQEKEARNLLKEVDFKDSIFASDVYYNNWLFHNTQLLYLYSKHFSYKVTNFGNSLMVRILKPILNEEFNTLSAAFTLLALNSYMNVVRPDADGAFKVTQVINGKGAAAQSKSIGLLLKAWFNPKATQVNIAPSKRISYYYQLLQGGYDSELPKKEVKNGIEVYREFRNESGEVVTKAKLGEKLTVYIKVRSLNGGPLYHIAVADLLTGGLEADFKSIRQPRTDSYESEDGQSGQGFRFQNGYDFPEYVDIRDDRILVFGNVKTSAQSFQYKVRAISKGKFRIPPISAESMYDRSIYAVGKSEIFEVTD